MSSAKTHRILVIDDTSAIHDDLRKILVSSRRGPDALAAAAAELFGDDDAKDFPANAPAFEIASAFQGAEGLELVTRALAEGRPFAMAFVDVRMPPGWDGVETIERIWRVQPDLQVVMCTAYSDYSWSEMIGRLGHSDRLLILKKPFDNVEALQLATALTEKWNLTAQVRRHVAGLEQTVAHRTEELRRSEERFRLITENAAELISLIAPDGRVVYHSPSCRKLLGKTEDDLSGASSFEFVHPDDRDHLAATLRRDLETGSSHVIELRNPRGDAVLRTIEAQAVPFRNAAGAIEGVLFVGRDVTERRMLELQLRHAQKLESIGGLAAGIAHEINTPTQYIGDNTVFVRDGFAELRKLVEAQARLLAAAEAGAITPELVAATRAVERATDTAYLFGEIPKAIAQTLEGVERTAKIVQAMRNFCHPGTEEKVPVNVNQSVEDALIICRNAWRYVADVVTHLETDLPPVPALPAEFNQVLINILINATHAIADVVGDGDKGKGTITVSTRRDGDWAEVRIHDTGPGIPDKIRSRIFDPFFTTKPVGKGTGQGLAIARSAVVDRHGGTLTFETAPGSGTTFIIRLPMQHAQAQAARPEKEGEAA
jgi:PAS domain S-box-containing protein